MIFETCIMIFRSVIKENFQIFCFGHVGQFTANYGEMSGAVEREGRGGDKGHGKNTLGFYYQSCSPVMIELGFITLRFDVEVFLGFVASSRNRGRSRWVLVMLGSEAELRLRWRGLSILVLPWRGGFWGDGGFEQHGFDTHILIRDRMGYFGFCKALWWSRATC
jgi:hypothetical protein